MRLLDRYLLRELLAPFVYCLGGFLIFWMSSDLFNKIGEFQRASMNLGDILEYYVVKSPELLSITLPIALLLALLYALTQHARHNEITAMRAAGVSLWRVALPYLVVGFLASVALFLINEFLSPDADARAEFIKSRRSQKGGEKMDRRLVRNFGFFNARDGRNWTMKLLNSETMEMTSPLIISTSRDGSQFWFYASRSVHSNGVWVFFDVREYRSDPVTNATPVPTIQTAIMSRPDFTETPEEIRSEVSIAPLLTLKNRHRANISMSEINNYLALHPKLGRTDTFLLYTKLHSRIAGPWKCLVVVLIALPFGAASGRRNVFVGVAGSIVICFAYFVLMEVSLAAGASGNLPAWLAGWLPNIAFTGIAIWLTSRAR